MKKLVLALLAVAVMAGAAFAEGEEMKVKVGLEMANNLNESNSGGNIDMDMGFGGSLEFLFPVASIVKIGPGIGVSYAGIKQTPDMKANGVTESFTNVPIYATIEVNPIKEAPGVFFKGSLGLNIGTLSVSGPSIMGVNSGSSSGSGIYYGIGAGYQFPFGLFLDAMYSGNGAAEEGGGTITYSKVSISAGYKFAL